MKLYDIFREAANGQYCNFEHFICCLYSRDANRVNCCDNMEECTLNFKAVIYELVPTFILAFLAVVMVSLYTNTGKKIADLAVIFV